MAVAVLSGDLEVALERQRRLVAMAPFVSDPGARKEGERAFDDLAAQIPVLLRSLGYGPSHQLFQRSADLTQLGSMVLAFARDERLYQASAMAAEFSQSMQALQRQAAAERQRRSRAAEAVLESIVSSSRTLIAWVCAAAAVCGLLIGPVGLLLLRRVLTRLQGVGTALVRLARNDTSVDIPGLTHQDEVGKLARSVAVFKSKSIELLQKKGELERLNLQLDAAINNMPLGLSMFDAQERLLVCNRRYAEMYDLPDELTRPGTARCALWDHRERKGARHYPVDEDGEPGSDRPGRLDDIEFGNERIISVARQSLQGRRLGGAARGRHPAPAPGAGDHAPGAPRCAHQPGQPRAVPRAAAGGAAAPAARPGLCRLLPRPRPLQGRQRHARASGRRRAAEAGQRAPAQLRASGRSRGPAGRRRVRHHPGQRARHRQQRGAGRAHRRVHRQALRDQRAPRRDLHHPSASRWRRATAPMPTSS